MKRTFSLHTQSALTKKKQLCFTHLSLLLFEPCENNRTKWRKQQLVNLDQQTDHWVWKCPELLQVTWTGCPPGSVRSPLPAPLGTPACCLPTETLFQPLLSSCWCLMDSMQRWGLDSKWQNSLSIFHMGQSKNKQLSFRAKITTN